MRKALPVLLFALLFPAPNVASAVQEEETVLRARSVMMTVLRDGKRVGKDLVVDVTIESVGGRYVATWNAVQVDTIDLPGGAKRTHLRAEHYGTDCGTINNIEVKERVVTFDIARPRGDMIVNIYRTGKLGLDIEIKAYGTRYSNKKQQTSNEEWVMTDSVTLPSKEILGYPERKSKKR